MALSPMFQAFVELDPILPARAVITPAADLDDLRQVFVITDFDIVE